VFRGGGRGGPKIGVTVSEKGLDIISCASFAPLQQQIQNKYMHSDECSSVLEHYHPTYLSF
jgi:hypothetical protein